MNFCVDLLALLFGRSNGRDSASKCGASAEAQDTWRVNQEHGRRRNSGECGLRKRFLRGIGLVGHREMDWFARYLTSLRLTLMVVHSQGVFSFALTLIIYTFTPRALHTPRRAPQQISRISGSHCALSLLISSAIILDIPRAGPALIRPQLSSSPSRNCPP